MRQVAIAFATTGPSPKAGHRISEIVLVGQENGNREHEQLRFNLNEGAFPSALATMKAFIGDATVIVHNAGKWRSFLRAELKKIKRHGASHFMGNLIDVGAWAHQRFPRQRREVAAIARRMGIKVEKELSGLEREAELLRLIAGAMNTSAETIVKKTIPTATAVDAPGLIATKIQETHVTQVSLNWIERVGNLWRMLTGKM